MTDVNFDNLTRAAQAALEAELELARNRVNELEQENAELEGEILELGIRVDELNDEIEALMAEMDDF